MEMTQQHKQEIDRLASGISCTKNFTCYKSGSGKLCKARDFGVEGYIDCLEKEAQICDFSLPFGDGYFCTCPIRIYISKKLKK